MAGIYIHIPFCKQACHYCDFHFSTSFKKKNELIHALIKELELRKDELENHTIETIYFGGGTPSLLSNDEIELIINSVYKNYQVIDTPEITLEANPDDLTNQRINDLANTPINRLSIGVQSFFEDDLKLMNRAHNAVEAKACLSTATRYFDNITIDLIYGIPNLSNQQWRENLNVAFGFDINHISSYALTVEPKTALDAFIKQGKYPSLDEQQAQEQFDILVVETQKQGFVHYEISNFGKPNYFSKHNTSYWLGKPYLGIGPSAHSFNGKQRSWNVRNNSKYIRSIAVGILPNEIETLSKNDSFNESIMIGLRTIWGISLTTIEQVFGASYKTHLLSTAKEYISQGLLEVSNTDNTLKTTQKGQFLIDGIASNLFMIN
ncbi:radical SAM family heme chaperone HemW [Ichthyenterobacterium magnum]|uniref:Heme chaperone HemW n=1 Tax=Ichthyenterobacterium magnum TaxID=1230530 RepID=A0A420DW69_9FLAO|nr:radical SAM family heme chaperone HemW [Ichthyenterobacterium magnum]RKE98459.1 oxygen-independent coproporphyrinogen-3 oxidase [Ichthyenterobacterium magnum]